MLSGPIVSSISSTVTPRTNISQPSNNGNTVVVNDEPRVFKNNGQIDVQHSSPPERLTRPQSSSSFSKSIFQQYENFFKCCCICLVRRRKSISSYDEQEEDGDDDGQDKLDGANLEPSSVVNSIYRIDYNSNSTSILPVISYHMVKAINGRSSNYNYNNCHNTNNSDAISVISSNTSNQQLSSHTPSGILKKPPPQVDAAGDYERAIGYDRPQSNRHDNYTDSKAQDVDSDDSTATRIIEKSELFHHFEPNVRIERPKSSYISHPEADTIVITRPKTVDGGGDLKLTLEIEPIDKITIRTPPKTPESRASTPKGRTTPTKSPEPGVRSDREQSQETGISASQKPNSPSPIPLPSSAPIPLPPPPSASTPNIIPLPPPPTAVSPVPTQSESHASNYTSPSPSPVPESDIVERSPTPDPERRQSYVEQPIAPRPDSNKPHVPHFNTPQSIVPLSNDSYESTTDTEHHQQGMQGSVPKRVARAIPKKVKPVSSQSNVGKKRDKHEEKVERPRDLLVNCFLKLQSSNWEEIMEGLESFQNLSNNHAELVDANLHLMTIELSKQIKNLRSQVARSACQVAGELFHTHRRTIEPEAEELTAMLLTRTSDTNKFLRADAIRALESMCDNLPVAKVIHLLAFKGATHHNGLVKCATAKLLSRVVERIGGDKVFVLSKETRDKLILTTANLLMEGSLDTRSYAKEIFSHLAAGHPNCSKILIDVIPPRVYRNIEKTLKSLLA